MQLETLPAALGDRCFRCRSLLRVPDHVEEAAIRCLTCAAVQHWRANSNPAARAVDALRDVLGVPDKPEALKGGIGERCAVEDCAAVAGPLGYCEACLAMYPGLWAEGPEGKSLLASEQAEAKAELEKMQEESNSSELEQPPAEPVKKAPADLLKSENEALQASPPSSEGEALKAEASNSIEITLKPAEGAHTHALDLKANLKGEPYPNEFDQVPLLFHLPLENGRTLRIQIAARLI